MGREYLEQDVYSLTVFVKDIVYGEMSDNISPFTFTLESVILHIMIDSDPYLKQGWRLSEFMNWIPVEAKEELLGMVGENNYVILSEQHTPQKNMWKAQFLISPTGVEILNLYFIPAAGNG